MSKSLEIKATSTLEDVKFNLRLPKNLYEWLKVFADQQGRSINAQIVQLIKEERERRERAAE
jgi:hypothetical protein